MEQNIYTQQIHHATHHLISDKCPYYKLNYAVKVDSNHTAWNYLMSTMYSPQMVHEQSNYKDPKDINSSECSRKNQQDFVLKLLTNQICILVETTVSDENKTLLN